MSPVHQLYFITTLTGTPEGVDSQQEGVKSRAEVIDSQQEGVNSSPDHSRIPDHYTIRIQLATINRYDRIPVCKVASQGLNVRVEL
eukprot:8133322-Pyramimonas_sp.AAC.2